MNKKKRRLLHHDVSQDEFSEKIKSLLTELCKGGTTPSPKAEQRIHDVSFRLAEVRDHCYSILEAIERLPEALVLAQCDSVVLWLACSNLRGMLWSAREYTKLAGKTLEAIDRLSTRLPPLAELNEDEYSELTRRFVNVTTDQSLSGKVEDEHLLVRRLISEIKEQRRAEGSH